MQAASTLRSFRVLARSGARAWRAAMPVALALWLLGGCGKSDNGMPGSTSGSGMQTPARGSLLQTPDLVSTITAPALLLELAAAANQQLFSLSGSPVCDILVYSIRYQTVGARGEPATASAALMVPSGAGSNCTGARPLVLYAHGTTTDRTFTMANTQGAESLSLAALFASQGYLVIAPNYAGYDTSSLPYTAYLVADQNSNDMIDALAAARSALPLASAGTTKDSGRLFVMGYSQGGYVAMATERALQTLGTNVAAAAPMSGPYALAAFVDAVFYGEVNDSATVSSALLITSYQRAYGTIYTSPEQVFEAPYAASIDSLLPSATPRSELYADGKLPQNALFSATPPAAAFADITPARTPANLAPLFAQGFGAGNLIRNDYRLSYLEDAAAHPDGGFPTLGSDLAAAAAQLPLRQALARNDLRDFVPTAPTLLCGGDADPTVFWLNTELEQAYWAGRASALSAPAVLDLEAAAAPGDPYASLKSGFALAKNLYAADAVAHGAADGGALAVAQAYHATLVAPFCFAAAKSFFAAH